MNELEERFAAMLECRRIRRRARNLILRRRGEVQLSRRAG